jgi:hypothetical protein
MTTVTKLKVRRHQFSELFVAQADLCFGTTVDSRYAQKIIINDEGIQRVIISSY